ncbi:uncharacterized protein LOC133871456 [Alnus glutinosa]|uniref:uncharacterized protein LOC133871456 n=1 Tax=Alnus glutinosa TaxID=3517 RepID=UPI002D794167|nr:uncharacterized protein LOC133871456 [Alnus glutinosa]
MEIGKEVRVGNATHRNEEKNALIDEQKGRKRGKVSTTNTMGGHIMFNECLMFEVHHGGRFNRENGVAYVGGDVTNYPDLYDKDELSFFDVETVVKCYGYSPGDLIYYRIPNKSLDEGLRLLFSDHDVIETVGHHNGHGVAELYVVGFILYDVPVDLPRGEESVDEEYEKEYERNTVYRRDPFWNEVISDDSDALEVNADTGYAEAGASVEGEDVGVDQEFVGEPSHVAEEDLEAEVAVALAAAEDEFAQGVGKGKGKGKGVVEGEDEPVSDVSRSDILTTPDNTSGDDEPDSSKRSCVTKRVPFSKSDFEKPTLQKVCGEKNCKYRVYGRQLKGEATFMLISLRPKHTCARKYKNHLITSKWIAEWCLDSFRDQPNMLVEVLKKKVKTKWNVKIHPSTLYRARKRAQEVIYGKLGEQYHRLWDYCATIRSTNVGSCVILMVERPMPEMPCRFQRMYISLAAMKNGFKDGCRPVISLDACLLKGVYKGQLMEAVGRDANNNMYPISMVVVEAETKDSWSWFLEALLANLGPSGVRRWTFISDRQKGLVPSLMEVCPNAEHRICVQHLYANFWNDGHQGVLLKDLLWRAAASYTQNEFYAVMEELKGLNLPAYEYLSKVDLATWCKGWFNTYAKCDLLHNNLAECFNSWITKFRDKTILVMLEGIRTSLMRRYQRKREIIAAMEGNVGPKIKEKLEKEDEAGHCTPIFAGDGLFEVECRGRRYAVNLPAKTCGCRKWDVSGIPCAHAISSIWHGGGNPEDYLSPYFGKEMYLKAYTPIIYPVPSEEQ